MNTQNGSITMGRDSAHGDWMTDGELNIRRICILFNSGNEIDARNKLIDSGIPVAAFATAAIEWMTETGLRRLFGLSEIPISHKAVDRADGCSIGDDGKSKCPCSTWCRNFSLLPEREYVEKKRAELPHAPMCDGFGQRKK